MALGATHGSLRATLLRQTLLPVAGGLLCGIPGAIAGVRLTSHLLFEPEKPAPAMVATAGAFLLAAALIACWRAGARVMAIDPLEAIRAE